MHSDIIQVALGIVILVLSLKLLKDFLKLAISAIAIVYIAVNFVGMDNIINIVNKAIDWVQSPSSTHVAKAITMVMFKIWPKIE